MMSAGEQTGKIDSMLERIADFLDEEIETTLSGLTSLIEPLLIVFLGSWSVVLLFVCFLPIFKMSEIYQYSGTTAANTGSQGRPNTNFASQSRETTLLSRTWPEFLLVDDEITMLQMVSELLRSEGTRCIHSTTPRLASSTREYQPELVITDLYSRQGQGRRARYPQEGRVHESRP
jgi:CheY-like chemotaxis protein